MTDQAKRTHWLGAENRTADKGRDGQYKLDRQIEEKPVGPIAPGADGRAGTSSEAEAESQSD